MGLFVDRNKPKINRQQAKVIKKQIGIDMSQYAKKDEIDEILNNRATSEKRQRIWASLSPRLKMKVLNFVKEKHQNGRK